MKNYKLFISENINNSNEFEELSNDIKSSLKDVDNKTLSKIDDVFDDDDIDMIINGEKTIDQVSVEIFNKLEDKKEGLISFTIITIIKLYIAKKILQTIFNRFPNSFIGKIKQNINLVLDVKSKFAVIDITKLKEDKKFNNKELEKLIVEIIDSNIVLKDIFISNGRDEDGHSDKNLHYLIVRSKDIHNISKILYDSNIGTGVDFYSGYELKMNYTNINNIINDAYFNYFINKIYKIHKPSNIRSLINSIKKIGFENQLKK
jgi:hypothetical protein